MTEHLIFGCDPELFLKQDGRTIGSEKVVGDGIELPVAKIVKDGIQVELNPTASSSLEELGANIAQSLEHLDSVAKINNAEIDLNVLVNVDINEYESLSKDCKTFGCKPSFNVTDGYPLVAEVDPSIYLARSAGGHIHIGTKDKELLKILKDPKRLIPVLDAVVGNTAVILDRDTGNIERRKHYGRAGEYRLPSYGIEYRTLSNFWLKSPKLFYLFFNLAKISVNIVELGLEKELFGRVSYEDVASAIQNNDKDLAKRNYSEVVKMLNSIETTLSIHLPEDIESLGDFSSITTDEMLKDWRKNGTIDPFNKQ